MMVVGSTINDVMKVTPPPPGALKEEKTTSGKIGWDEIEHKYSIYLTPFYYQGDKLSKENVGACARSCPGLTQTLLPTI